MENDRNVELDAIRDLFFSVCITMLGAFLIFAIVF
jgi:hypothetical protein